MFSCRCGQLPPKFGYGFCSPRSLEIVKLDEAVLNCVPETAGDACVDHIGSSALVALMDQHGSKAWSRTELPAFVSA